MGTAVRVIKLGGSLLDYGGLPAALLAWLDRQPPLVNVLVVGGGRAADAVRQADHVHRLDPSAAHWLAIRAMGLAARLVAELLPGSRLTQSAAEVLAAASDDAPPGGGAWILDPLRFLQEEDSRSGSPLPHDWSVTSDSIAARVATALAADELVLLKSRLPAATASRQSAAAAGYVDAFFPQAARVLDRVRCVDLRGESFPERRL